ncbi:MAG: hypothetical protein AB1412_03995 [Pseudomonadota bacterium]
MHDRHPTPQFLAVQGKRCAWVALTKLAPHLHGKRRGTQRHQNRLRNQRMGRTKHAGRAD